MVCDYWFFDHGFKFKDSVCNGCHNLIYILNISDILLSLLKVLVIVVLFMALTNLKQFIY